jgi:hypothetical protein
MPQKNEVDSSFVIRHIAYVCIIATKWFEYIFSPAGLPVFGFSFGDIKAPEAYEANDA